MVNMILSCERETNSPREHVIIWWTAKYSRQALTIAYTHLLGSTLSISEMSSKILLLGLTLVVIISLGVRWPARAHNPVGGRRQSQKAQD